MAQSRILIITHDVVDGNMAGPAIRCWEFARILSQEAEVTLPELDDSLLDLEEAEGEL